MKKNKNKIIFSVLTFAFLMTIPLSLLADEKKETLILSLPQALEMARQRHINVIVANERVNQAIARIGENRSTLLPQLNGQISQQRQTRNLQTLGISASDPLVGPFNSFDARVQLTQTIFDLAAIKRLNAAQDAEQLSLAELRKAEQDVLALVATLFLEAKRAQENTTAADAVFTHAKERFKIIYRKFKNGSGSLIDVQQAAASREKSFHDWRAVVARSVDRRLDLAAALGIPFRQPIQFQEDKNLENNQLPSDAEILAALTDHPDIEVARQDLNVAKNQLASEQTGYLPKLSAVANYGPSGEDPSNSDNTYLVGVQASVPILEGGLRQSRTKEMASQVKAGEEILKDIQRHSEAKILSAVESIKESRLLLKQRRTEFRAARHNFDLTQSRLNSGTGNKIELLEALAQKSISDDNVKEAEATYLLSEVNLAHALGKVDQLFTNKNNESVLNKGEQGEK